MDPHDLVPAQLSDADLLAEVARLAACERAATAALVALLAEVEARRLHLADGCSSLFSYCTERLHLSEHAAYHRIEAARAVRAFPVILAHLRGGSLTLTAVTLLRPHLTEENHERLLTAACGRSKREVEVLVRGVAPLPEVRASVRKLPAAGRAAVRSPTGPPVVSMARDEQRAAGPPVAGAPSLAADVPPSPASAPAPSLASDAPPSPAADAPPTPASAALPTMAGAALALGALDGDGGGAAPAGRPAASRPSAIHVLAPERYSLRVTLSAEGHARLRRAQDLLRHTVPDGDPAVIVERALALLVARLDRQKFALRQESGRPERSRQDGATGTTPRTPGGPDAEATGPAGRVDQPVDPGPDITEPQTKPAPIAVSREPGANCSGRHSARTISAAVKRAVWAREEGRCSFRGAGGRCRETGRLEYHHRLPVADGGAGSVENVVLLCTAHHARESERWFGEVRARAGAGDGARASVANAGTRSGPS